MMEDTHTHIQISPIILSELSVHVYSASFSFCGIMDFYAVSLHILLYK